MFAAFDDASQQLLARCLYWTMPIVLVLWGIAGVRRWRLAETSIAERWRRHAPGLVAALLVALAALWLAPPQMRMQFDETSLCGTAQGMHLQRTATMGLAAMPDAEGLAIVESRLDKRPPLFSFLVSIAHDLTGYRPANAFAVNLIAFFLLLAVLAVAATNRAGRWAGALAPLLVASVPLALAAATSAGFELLALMLLAFVVVAALDYLAVPGPVRLQWLLANGLLFAQARYESVFVFALVLGLVVLRHRGLRPGRFGIALVAIAPVLLLPIALLLLHSRDPGFYPEANGRDLVSLSNLSTNVGPFLGAFFAPGLSHPFPGLLGLVSVAIYAAWVWARRCTFGDLVVIAPVLAVTGIVWLWFYGDVNEPTALRLYLPIAVLGALGPLLLVRAGSHAMHGIVAPALALAVIAFATPRGLDLRRGEVLPQSSTSRLLEQTERVLDNVEHRADRTLWVTTLSQYFIVHGRAAVTPRAFAAHEARTKVYDVFVLATPLDARLLAAGDPTEVVDERPFVELGRASDPDSDAQFVVYRLRR